MYDLSSASRSWSAITTPACSEKDCYWALLEAVHALYKRAGVTVPVSESGRTMPWHSLRHSFGSDCAARGVPLPTIKELMGHADIQTTMRYVTVRGPARCGDLAGVRIIWPTGGLAPSKEPANRLC
jgi:integrase